MLAYCSKSVLPLPKVITLIYAIAFYSLASYTQIIILLIMISAKLINASMK